MPYKEVRLVSQTKNRIRFQSQLFKGTNAEEIQAELSNLAGVDSVRINSITGSVIVFCDGEKFNPEDFKQTFYSLAQNFQPSETANQASLTKGDVQRSLKKRIFLRQKLRKIENRSMAVFGTACLVGVLTKSWRLHSWAGWFFAIASLAHTYRYRKSVW